MTSTTVLASATVVSPALVTVTWQDGLRAEFHASWLAHNCACASCRQPSSGQRLATRLDPSSSAYIVSCTTTEKQLHVKFHNHMGVMDAWWLRQHCYSTAVMRAERARRCALVDKLHVQTFDYKTMTSARDWMISVARQGLCIIKNVPTLQAELLNFVKTSGCEPSHVELYGTTFQVQTTPDPINIAYSSEGLEPHQDLAYYESPPGIQLLHCIKFDECITGGESTFVDAHAAAELLRIRNPAAFKALCEIPATFQKDHVHREHPAKMFFCRPHIIVEPVAGDVVAVFWAPAFEGPLHVPPYLVDTYYKAYRAFEEILSSPDLWRDWGFSFRMIPGDLVVFNNRRMLHGRTAFSNNGERHLHGCYLELDSFLNRIRVDRYMTSEASKAVERTEMGNDEDWLMAQRRSSSSNKDDSTVLRAGWFGEWRMGNQSNL